MSTTTAFSERVATRYDDRVKSTNRGKFESKLDCTEDADVKKPEVSCAVPVHSVDRGTNARKRMMWMSVDGVKGLLYNLKRRLCSRTLRETLPSGEPRRGVAAEPTVSANSLGIRRRRFGSEETGVMGTRLFVGNISFKATEDSLRELFEQQGQVKDCHIVMDRETNRSKGFAFVEMSTQDEATEAIAKLDKFEFEGRPINVSEAKPKAEKKW